jgi:hypothetical protein
MTKISKQKKKLTPQDIWEILYKYEQQSKARARTTFDQVIKPNIVLNLDILLHILSEY